MARFATAVADALAPEGIELYGIELERGLCRVTVQRAGGLDLGAIERASRVISPMLDGEEWPDDASYVLEVSSPGLERPVRNALEASRSIGEMVSVVVSEESEAAVNRFFADGRLKGRLVATDGDRVQIQLMEGAVAGRERGARVKRGRSVGLDVGAGQGSTGDQLAPAKRGAMPEEGVAGRRAARRDAAVGGEAGVGGETGEESAGSEEVDRFVWISFREIVRMRTLFEWGASGISGNRRGPARLEPPAGVTVEAGTRR